MSVARGWIAACVVVLAAVSVQTPIPAEAQVTAAKDILLPCGLTVEARERVRDLWRELRAGLRASANNPANYPAVLYDMQLQTDSVLTMAGYCNDSWLLNELASYYLLAQQPSVRAAGKLVQDAQGFWYWPDSSSGTEVILSSSQFLAGVAHMYGTLMKRPRARRTAAMQMLLTQYQPIIKSHLTRWIWQQRSMWTWNQCGIPAGATELQAYTFDDFVRRRRNNCGPEDFATIPIIQAGGACLRYQYSSPLYCNALLEIELFVAQAGADFVSADDSQTEFAKLTADERTRIANYVRSAMALWESRVVPQTVSTSHCGTTTGYLIDPDGMRDHPTYSGSHWTNASPDIPTAWDLSHGRRFVRFLDTMYRNVNLSQPTLAQAQIRQGLANMIACKVWAADDSLLFTSFIDGSNPGITLSGTYYAPWSMSHSYMGGGFAAWASANSLLSSVNASILSALNTDGDNSTCAPPAMPANSSHSLPYCFFTYDAMNFRASLAHPPASQQALHVAGDWNGDGRADLFIHNEQSSGAEAGRSKLFLSSAPGYTLVDYPVAPGYDSALWKNAGAADFNGDGRTDLLIHAESAGHPDNGKTWLYLTQADGSHSDVGYPSTPGWDAAAWETFIADFSGDGIADALLHGNIVGTAQYGQTVLLTFKPDGTHTSRSGSQVPAWVAPWQVRGIGDFNGDGKADVLLHAEQPGHAENGRTTLHLFTDESYLTVPYPVAPGFDAAAYDVKGTGDFDGDGRADLLLNGKAGTAVHGHTVLYLFDEDGSARSVSYPAAPGFSEQLFAVRGIADFDGDGKSDLMIHGEQPGSTDNGKTYLFLFDEQAASYREIAYPTTPGWSAAVFRALPIVDWNGDGRADLIIHGIANSPYSGNTLIYLFNSNGSSSVVTGTAAPGFTSPPWSAYPSTQ
jgi:hypothetical protein